MIKRSADRGLIPYSLISGICSIVIFVFFTSLFKEPTSINQKFLNDILPSARYVFINRTNDFKYYLMGLITFSTVPLLIYTIWRFLKVYSLIILILFFALFYKQLLFLVNFSNIHLVQHIKLIVSLTAVSLVISIILKIRPAILRFLDHELVGVSRVIFLFAIFITIFVLIFNPKYKYSYESLALYGAKSCHQFHHVNFFLAPINEVLTGGKSLLADAHAQYGIMLTYFASIFLKIFGFSYSNFVLYNMLISIIYACIFFIFLKKLTNNLLISFIGVIAYIRLVFFRYIPSWEVFTLPSTTSLRYFFDIVVIFLIYDFFKNKRSYLKLLGLSTIVVLAFFYNPETGAAIFISYILALALDLFITFIKKNNFQTTYGKFLQYSFSVELAIILVAGAISIFTFIRSGHWPDWGSYLKYIFFYSKTNDVPMPIFDLYYLPLFIFFVSYLSILVKIYNKRFKNIQLLFFLLSYGLMLFVYYINLSEPNHLLTVIHPSLLLVFILFQEFKENLEHIRGNWTITSMFLLTLFFTLIGWVVLAASFPIKFHREIIDRLQYRYNVSNKNYYYWGYQGTDFYLKDNDGKDFILAANKIKALTGDKKEILILSRYDTLLDVMSKKTSLIDYPIIEYEISRISELKQIIGTILAKPPKYIFLFSKDYDEMDGEVIGLIWKNIENNYSFIENAGAIDVYKLKS